MEETAGKINLNNNNEKKIFQLTSASLHILAMGLMVLDHIWGTFPYIPDWFTCIGRIAFPIFAFMIAEGFFHTHSFKKYALRMLIFALAAEVPFDLMYDGTPFNPTHQNVLFTFLIALMGMYLMEKAKKKGKWWLTLIVDVAVIGVSYILGILTMVDYNGPGVLIVYVFYFFHSRKWWCFISQLVLIMFISFKLIQGHFFPITVLNHYIEFPREALSAIALLPIWLYRGKQGYHSKPFQYFCYAFYPVHALILFIIAKLV